MNPEIKQRLKAISSGFSNIPLNYKNNTLPNDGYLLIDVPDELLHILNQEKTKIQSDFSKGIRANNVLAGHIEKEYKLDDSLKSLEDFAIIAAKKYLEIYDEKFLEIKTKFRLDNAWINFQQKGEFNPLHNHAGMLSFVIWLDIPYKIEDEFNFELSKDSNGPCSGCFNFVYTEVTGQIKNHTLKVDNQYNGKMIIFVSKMMHTVYPFYTSDNYRISVAGNIS